MGREITDSGQRGVLLEGCFQTFTLSEFMCLHTFNPLNINLGEIFWSWIRTDWGLSSGRENFRPVFTSSIKRRIRKFYVTYGGSEKKLLVFVDLFAVAVAFAVVLLKLFNGNCSRIPQ